MLHEFKVTIPLVFAEEAAALLVAAGITNVYYDVPFEVAKDENGYVSKKLENTVVDLMIYAEDDPDANLPASYFSSIEQVLQVGRESIFYQVVQTEDWTVPFEDIDLDNGWMIVFPDSHPSYADKQMILFDPQGAFGTGVHETTRDCLRIILDIDLQGKMVLDLGTGSGILSIAAALKGAGDVLAVDIEPVEREVQYHAEANGVSSVRVKQMDLLEENPSLDHERYDWIFINIGADETIQLVEQYTLFSKTNQFLISGVVEWSETRVADLFASHDFIVSDRIQTNEWVTFVFSKARC